MIQVYRIVNNVEEEVVKLPLQNAIHKTGIMNLDEIQILLVVDSILDIREGDYVKYNDIIYKLNRDVEYSIESEVKFSYELIFEHPQYTLLDKLIVNKLTGYSNFSLTGKLIDFVELIVWCINLTESNPLGVDYGWTVGDIVDSEFKNITFTDVNCREALRNLSEVFDCEYYFSNVGKTINFVEMIENETSYVFQQGKGKGLYSITQQNVDKEDTVTRVYVRGGNKNIPNHYADEEGYLKLPENYLENFSEHTKIVERKVKFEEEFPHFIGSIATVSGTNNNILTCPSIDFDIASVAVGKNARINFLSGDLMGNTFEFQWNYESKRITLIEKDDEIALPGTDGNKPQIPSSSKKAKVGDSFNFTGLLMPAQYVTASLNRLREKGNKWLDFYSRKRVKFNLDIDHRYLRDKPELNVGDLIVLSIPQRSFIKAIRITSIEKNFANGAINATVSNYLEDSWEKYLESRVREVTNSIIDKNTIDFTKGDYFINKKISEFLGNGNLRMEISSTDGNIVVDNIFDTDLVANVLIYTNDITDKVEKWTWTRQSGYEPDDMINDALWNDERKNNNSNTLTITSADVPTESVKFVCDALVDDIHVTQFVTI